MTKVDDKGNPKLPKYQAHRPKYPPSALDEEERARFEAYLAEKKAQEQKEQEE